MRHVKEMGKAAWSMAKAGLLYGAIGGGLFALSLVMVSLFLSLISIDARDRIIDLPAVLVGAALGGGVGVIVGAIDGPVLALLMRVQPPHQPILGRNNFIQSVNAMLTGIGSGIAFILLLRDPEPLALFYYFIIGCIAGGAFWYATDKYVDKVMLANPASEVG